MKQKVLAQPFWRDRYGTRSFFITDPKTLKFKYGRAKRSRTYRNIDVK